MQTIFSWLLWPKQRIKYTFTIGLMHDDVLLINFTTTPHSHALFARFFHLPCWYSFHFLSFGKHLHFECEAWWWNWSAKRHHTLGLLISVKFIFLDKALNSGKNVKTCDFHFFLVWSNKNPKYGCKMIVQTMVQICAKSFNLSVKYWRSYDHVPCSDGNCHPNFLSWCSFWAHWGRIWFIYFSGSLVDSFYSLCLFFREIKRKASIGNDGVIVLMTSSNLWRHSMGM